MEVFIRRRMFAHSVFPGGFRPILLLLFLLVRWYGWLALTGSDVAVATGLGQAPGCTVRQRSAFRVAALCGRGHNFANRECRLGKY
ncbi:hypothetical protein [Cupriavidus basilensis]|uniref:hypothetical protein n=1 Tax=Cupriavidus basilensis TaxID=68895 RepID=UPI001300C8BD|nr:hypothetical protein [Cupriavidus basilensis]